MSIESFRTRVQKHFRRRRMRALERMFHLTPATRILDVGGTPFNWSLVESRPRITMVNIKGETRQFGNIEISRGDATALEFDDNSFDLVYSNSVIEHVGDWQKMKACARHVRRLSPSYYIQTPNKWFPVEPHCFGLFFHWFPVRIQRRLYRWLSLTAWCNRPNQETIDRHLRGTTLLTERDLRQLFPDATLLKERTWLFPFIAKSFIAVRGAELSAGRTPLLPAWRRRERRVLQATR